MRWPTGASRTSTAARISPSLPCRDWGETLIRHFLYDTAETVRWEALANSTWEALGAVARRAFAEERSHLRHASGLLSRLLRTDTGCSQLLPLFDQFAPMACELFDVPPGCSDEALVASGVMAPRVERSACRVAGNGRRRGRCGWVPTAVACPRRHCQHRQAVEPASDHPILRPCTPRWSRCSRSIPRRSGSANPLGARAVGGASGTVRHM